MAHSFLSELVLTSARIRSLLRLLSALPRRQPYWTREFSIGHLDVEAVQVAVSRIG